ncbi:hypothetical protein [Lysobacter sp. Hz 25]|uniref:hypothetical protein n=1 Tax=Lysobacter sp. Hz 25 TaxID=3383698 RepID=UPI0038D4FF47
MAKFLCKCEHVINLISSPAPEQFILVPEGLLDDLANEVSAKVMQFDLFFSRIDAVGRAVIECPVCARIWIKNRVGEAYNPYLRE